MDVDEGSFLTISIHAPHMGSDLGRRTGVVLLSIISIHTPRMGSNDIRERADAVRNISIHAHRGGERQYQERRRFWQRYFNPRSPWGGATVCHVSKPCIDKFQSTLPVGGSDLC